MNDDVFRIGLAPLKMEGQSIDTDPGAPRRAPLSAEAQLRHDMHFYGDLAHSRLEDVIERAETLSPEGAKEIQAMTDAVMAKIREIAGPDPC